VLIERILKLASAQPRKIAIEDGDDRISYGALAHRISSIPPTSGGQTIPVVAKGASFVLGLLEAWRQGMVPVPIDPTIPSLRRGEIECLARLSSESSLAYCIATSGSSGSPKLVQVPWDGLLAVLDEQVEAFELNPGARVLWMLSPGFDASLSDVLTALLSGATLCCAPADAAPVLPGLLRELRITHLDIPPALLPIYQVEDFPSCLRTMIVGGAASDPALLRAWARRFRVVAVYGPTEATICSSLSVVDETWDAPYLGQPIAGFNYRVVENELCIGGPGVALGYAGTESPNFWSENGTRWFRTGDCVQESRGPHGPIYQGRRDRQVQHHGQRLEPEEVEARLRPLLRGSVAVVPTSQGLAAYWEGPGRREEAEPALRQALPAAWLPRVWQPLEKLPRLPNGKIDLVSLQQRQDRAEELDSLEAIRRRACLEQAGMGGAAYGSPGEPARTPLELDLLARSLAPRSVPAAASVPNEALGEGKALLVTGGSGILGSALLSKLKGQIPLLQLGHRTPLQGAVNLFGDIEKPRLGLTRRAWDDVRRQVGAVLHLAARLNLESPLSETLTSNASPLRNLAELGVPIILASSLAVELSASPAPRVLDGLHTPERIHGGYAQSKWVAERLWAHLGCGGVVLRYGLLIGPPGPRQLLAMTVRGLAELGCYPRDSGRLAMDATPLGFAATETLRLLREPWSGGTVAVSSKVRVTLFDLLRAVADCGYPLEAVSSGKFFGLRPPSADSVVAQLALSRLHPEGANRDWDLFLMTDTEWGKGDSCLPRGVVLSSLARYVQAALAKG
jgi:acyl-CoA synthetase (AMP-forming)/AMP-acid ligase II/nucleoside-diphosphate-sugar epimerase